jgi:hypothetical protein
VQLRAGGFDRGEGMQCVVVRRPPRLQAF